MKVIDSDTSIKLKSKGFNEPVFFYYQKGVLQTDNCFNRYNNGSPVISSAPFIIQVLEWLRTKKLHFELVAAAYGYNLIISDTPEAGATDRYYTHANDDGPNDGGAWDDPDECLVFGINYVLDKLI